MISVLTINIRDDDEECALASQMAALSYANHCPDREYARKLITAVGAIQGRSAEWLEDNIKSSDRFYTSGCWARQPIDPTPAG